MDGGLQDDSTVEKYCLDGVNVVSTKEPMALSCLVSVVLSAACGATGWVMFSQHLRGCLLSKEHHLTNTVPVNNLADQVHCVQASLPLFKCTSGRIIHPHLTV